MTTYYYIDGAQVKYITLSVSEYIEEAKTKTLYSTEADARRAKQ